MAESFIERRRRELGISGSTTPNASSGSFVERRKKELGLVQDAVTSPDAMDAAFRQEAQTTPSLQPQVELPTDPGAADSAFREENKPLPNRELPVIGNKLQMFDWIPGNPLSMLKKLDYISDNPISNAISEYVQPDQPMFKDGEIMPGTSARQEFLQRSGQEAATGIPKFIGQVAAPFFVPGAGLGTGNAASEAARGFVSRTAPRLQGLGGSALREGIAGAAVGAGSEYAQGEADPTQAIISGGLGAAGGAALPLVGRALQNTKLGQRFTRLLTPDNQEPVEMLGLPSPKPRPGEALPVGRGNVSGDPIATPYTFKLNDPSPSTIQGLRNVEEATSEINAINNQLKDLENRYTQSVQDQYKYLKDSMANRGGVTQGSLIYDQHGNVVNRVGRISENPQWYREFYAETGRKPTNKELYQLAKKHVDEGYQDDMGFIPAWKQQNAYDDSMEGLGQVRDNLRQYVKENGLGLTDSTLKSSELTFPTNRRQPAQGEMLQAPKSTIQDAAQSLGRDIQPAPSETTNPASLQRGFTETLMQSDKTAPGLRERLKTAYTPIPNEVSVNQANTRINSDLEAAASFVMGKSHTSAEKVTTAHRLIDEFSKQGNYERANDIADKIATELTKAGQSVQAASIYNRLTPEGILVHANRIAQRVNEKLPITAKEVKVTPDMAASITDLAQTTQKMTGVQGLANNVIGILDKAKSGATLSETETAALRNFVNDSKQFVQETTRKPRAPRAPQQPKDKRVRDNVVSFLDAQEAAAKERLRARGIQISSTPLDVWADYAVIGAAKIAKGAIKFADWSEVMVKELGESIRPQLQQLYDRSVQAFEHSTKTVTRQTISEAEKLTEKVIKDKQLEPAASESLRSLAQKVSGLSGEEKRLAAQDLQAILQGLERPGTLKRVSSIQTIGQLLNPKTQVRNALGNELFYRVERLNKLVSTPIDVVRSKVTGGARTVTFRTNNQGEYWTNWMRGLKAGWKGVNINGLETQYDLASPAFRGKYNPLTYMEKSLGAALKSFDTAAYMRAYNNTIGEMATLRALNEGQRGNKALIDKYIREADDNMMKIADEYGRYVTFQDNNAISNTLVKAKRTLNLGKDFGLGDLVLKYPKTPGAILMRALEYSPAGFIRSGMILSRPWMKKEPNTAEATQALSRAMIGTFGLTGLGYFLMDNDVVTGSASKDRDVRDLQKSAGQGQYQVNLSALKRLVESGFNTTAAKLKEGDLLYTYDWMQPISMAISMGANISKNMSEGKQKFSGLVGTAYNSVEGGLGTLTEQSVLQGLKRAAEGYPGQTVTDKITDILSDIPASFVPTAANQVKQLTDNSRPETYSPNKLEQSLNKAQAKMPGAAGRLPKQFDTLGRPKEVYQDNNAANVLFNPGFASRYELSPEAKMVVDLINETGDESLAPRVPGKTITIDDPNDRKKNIQLKLNGDQFSRYQQLQGEKTRENIIKRYKPEATQKSRSDRMKDILTDSGEKARKELKKELGVR